MTHKAFSIPAKIITTSFEQRTSAAPQHVYPCLESSDSIASITKGLVTISEMKMLIIPSWNESAHVPSPSPGRLFRLFPSSTWIACFTARLFRISDILAAGMPFFMLLLLLLLILPIAARVCSPFSTKWGSRISPLASTVDPQSNNTPWSRPQSNNTPWSRPWLNNTPRSLGVAVCNFHEHLQCC